MKKSIVLILLVLPFLFLAAVIGGNHHDRPLRLEAERLLTRQAPLLGKGWCMLLGFTAPGEDYFSVGKQRVDAYLNGTGGGQNTLVIH